MVPTYLPQPTTLPGGPLTPMPTPDLATHPAQRVDWPRAAPALTPLVTRHAVRGPALAWILLLGRLLISTASGAFQWWMPALLLVIAALLGFGVWAQVRRFGHSARTAGELTYLLTPDALHVQGASGSRDVPPSAIRRIWVYPEGVVVSARGTGDVTLPTAPVSAALQP